MMYKPEELAERLYTIKLGEFAYPDNTSSYTRVPGGWVFGDMHGCCFIPLDNEFQKTNSEDK